MSFSGTISTFACVLRWMPRPNLEASFFPHTLQEYGLSLAWTSKMCLSNLLLNRKPFPHNLQTCGRTGRWIIWWELSLSFVSKALPHVSQWNVFAPPWLCRALCRWWLPLVLLRNPQISHLYFRSVECDVMCALSIVAKLKLRPQILQRNGFSLVCLQRMCAFNAESQLKSRPHCLQLNTLNRPVIVVVGV